MKDQDELALLRRRVAALETSERWRGRVYRWLAIVAGLGVVCYAGAGLAADGACPNGYPFCFQGGTPALASDINTNFDQIRDWLVQKIGPTGSADVALVGGKLQVDESNAAYDVWLQGNTTSAAGGDARNLAMLGTSEAGGDQLFLNYGGEYSNGTVVQSSLTVTGDLAVTGNITVSGQSQGCYTRWGEHGCNAAYTEVVQGHGGGLESFSDTGGAQYSNVQCVSDSASVLATFGSYYTRFMRGEADGDGMDGVRSRCSTCCRGGCYTALGTAGCATGYSAMYTGRIGGIEGFNGQRSLAQTMCVDGNATSLFNWSTGYSTRLMRFQDVTVTGNSTGMQSVTNSCAVCCK